MDVQGDRIIFSAPEQLMAELPEMILRGEALSTAHRVFSQAEKCEGLAVELDASQLIDQRAQAAGLLRKVQFLRRLGTQLAEKGADTIGGSVEEYLKEQSS